MFWVFVSYSSSPAEMESCPEQAQTNNANIAPAPLLFVAAAGTIFSDFSTSNYQQQDMISDMSTSRRLAASQSNCHDRGA